MIVCLKFERITACLKDLRPNLFNPSFILRVMGKFWRRIKIKGFEGYDRSTSSSRVGVWYKEWNPNQLNYDIFYRIWYKHPYGTKRVMLEIEFGMGEIKSFLEHNLGMFQIIDRGVILTNEGIARFESLRKDRFERRQIVIAHQNSKVLYNQTMLYWGLLILGAIELLVLVLL